MWCEKIGKYGGVFIGGNGSKSYKKKHIYGQKKRVKVVENVLIECWKPGQSEKKRVFFNSDHRPILAWVNLV